LDQQVSNVFDVVQ